jgi:iron complex transport system substrate-binding protein
VRIVSFLPAATEIACALGLEEALVGVTHECDFPAAVRGKAVVVRSAVGAPAEADPGTIDRLVRERFGAGGSLYLVDEALFAALRPDLLLTQELCQVCAPSGHEVSTLLAALPRPPSVLTFSPDSIEGIFANVRALGEATGAAGAADSWIAGARERLERVRRAVAGATRPRVACLEWLDPLFAAGHWIPEQVELAGGEEVWGAPRGKSRERDLDSLLEADPEVLFLMPCGFPADAAADQAVQLLEREGVSSLAAVRDGRLFAVDAQAYFARPGPRVVEGTELLAHLLHPTRVPWEGPPEAFRRITPSRAPSRSPSPPPRRR